ncbi:type I restriction-modification system subunit M, partial [Vibrio splendidus]
GWIGRIFPFELVEKTYFKEELKHIQTISERLQTINTEIEELFNGLSEDDKESACVNEDKTAFVNGELNKEVKQIKADKKRGETFAKDGFENTLLAVSKLKSEEKTLKKSLKTADETLLEATKKKITELTKSEIEHLLLLKWVQPIVHSLAQLPQQLIQRLTNKLQALADKYAQT